MSNNYRADAESDAKRTVDNFIDEILEQLSDKGEASDDLLNDYPNGDSWHHESHVDKWYSLTDAAELIDQLSAFEETDSGLWQGQQPKEAIGTCAAFTYGNAVYHEWHELIEQINSEASDIISDFDDQASALETEIDDLKAQADGATKKNAKAYRRKAEHKQLDLDAIAEQKKTALREMIEEITG